VLLLALPLAPLVGFPAVGISPAWAQSADPAAEEANPRANFWRAVRKGDAGYSAVSGQETGVLIQNGGENWRALRNGPLTLYGGWFLVGVAVAILLFYLVRGTVKLERGRSGLTVPRWSAFERIVHWYTAMLFLLLMITGLSLLFGRYLLIPMIGKDAFAAWAGLAKQLHNYAGPFFAAGLLVELLKWVRHNIPKKVDAEWFARGGGMVGSKHPPAGRMNGGEKLWFWILATVGITMVASGFVLNFPNFEQTRGRSRLAWAWPHLGPAPVPAPGRGRRARRSRDGAPAQNGRARPGARR
jgi:formate dehydrogenase subunit gamma